MRTIIERAAVLGLLLLSMLYPYQNVQAGLVQGEVWLPAGAGQGTARGAELSAASAPGEGLTITARFSGVWALSTADGAFSTLRAEGAVVQQEGKYHLPVLRYTVELPRGAKPTISILSSDERRVSLSGEGLPPLLAEAPQPTCKCDTPSEKAAPKPVEPSTAFAEITSDVVRRGARVAVVTIRPVGYDPASGELVLRSTVTAQLHFNLPPGQAPRSANVAPDLPGLAAQVDQPLADGTTPQAGEAPLVYLILAPDSYLPSLQPFVRLKQSEGFSVRAVGLSTAGRTPEAIRAYIASAYQSAQPPAYLLLVGMPNNGADSLPTFASPLNGSATDVYYAAVDGADWVPDLLVGRVPARSKDQVDSFVARAVAFASRSGRESWLRQASFLATCDPDFYGMAEQSQLAAIQSYTLPGGYNGVFPTSPQPGGDRLFCKSSGAGFSAVQAALASGRSLVVYSGHGSPTGWELGVSAQSLPQLSGSTATPLILSYACQTGDLNTSGSLAEAWVNGGGALGFVGATANTYWSPDDVLEEAMFASLFSTPTGETVSAALQAGLSAVDLSAPEFSQYYYETYTLIGDPSLRPLAPPASIQPTLQNQMFLAGLFR